LPLFQQQLVISRNDLIELRYGKSSDNSDPIEYLLPKLIFLSLYIP
jgi:hypothetical protein